MLAHGAGQKLRGRKRAGGGPVSGEVQERLAVSPEGFEEGAGRVRVHAKERLSAGRWSRKTTWAAPSVVTRSVVTRRDQTLLASQVWGRP